MRIIIAPLETYFTRTYVIILHITIFKDLEINHGLDAIYE